MTDLANEIATAQTHALACFNVLTKHFQEPRLCGCCGCRVEDTGEFPRFIAAPSCLPGLNACEEYNIATDRVLELKALNSTTPR